MAESWPGSDTFDPVGKNYKTVTRKGIQMPEEKRIDLNTTVGRSDGIVASEVDGEVVMMSIEQGSYFGLNGVASDIWRLLETPLTVSQICDNVGTRYDVEKEQCRREVLAFLKDLADDGTIRVMGGDTAPDMPAPGMEP